jgi:hypothetical protein
MTCGGSLFLGEFFVAERLTDLSVKGDRTQGLVRYANVSANGSVQSVTGKPTVHAFRSDAQ